MPGINVIDNDGDLQRFPDATTWHVDDRGQLHLNNAAGPVASFAKDCWQGASTEDETNPRSPGPRTARLTVRCDGRNSSVKLNDLELVNLLLSGGFKIEFVRPIEGIPDQPQVTMTFAAGALDFDLDVDMLKSLMAVAEAEAEDV